MAKTLQRRITGLWKKETPKGRTLFEGKCSQEAIREALAEVASDGSDITLTIWINRAEDKRSESSPDASLVIGEQWVKPTENTDVVF